MQIRTLIIIGLVVIGAVTTIALRLQSSPASTVNLTHTPFTIIGAGEVLPTDFPELEITRNDGATLGSLYFANANPQELQVGNLSPNPEAYNIEYNTQTGQIVYADRIAVQTYDFKRLNKDRMVLYDLSIDDYVTNTLEARLPAGYGYKDGEFLVLNNDYEVIQRIGNLLEDGYGTDPHFFEIMPNGNYAYFEHFKEEVTAVESCPAPCMVITQKIVELTPSMEIVNVVPLGNIYTVSDLHNNEAAPGITEPFNDLTHANSLFGTTDNNYLVSVRSLNEVVLIDRDTHEAIWRFGGDKASHSDFEIVDDPQNGLSAQHSASILDNGNLLVFDNGNGHDPQVSRVVEYELDTDAMIANLVWSHEREDQIYTSRRGSVVRLSNGNTLINWVEGPRNIQEITPDGEVMLEVTLPEGNETYRANFWEYDS